MGALKSHLQTFCKSVGLYQRLKASRVYDLYWLITDGCIIDERTQEVEFYRKVLDGFQPGQLIFDVGANHGAKTDIFLRLGARVVAIEPDDVNQHILRQKFFEYRLRPKPVTIVGKAVSDRHATETMWIDEPGSAKNTLSRKWVDTLRHDEQRFGHRLDFPQTKDVESVTLEDLMMTYGPPFFVKVDVEGFEPRVLRGLQRPIPYVSFEVNLPEFRPEGLKCLELLNRVADGTFNYTADCRQGLALEQWLEARDFSEILERCTDRSIDVFWKTSSTARRP